LLDTGLDQKKVAYIIYAASALLGLVAAWCVNQHIFYLKLLACVLLMALFFAEVLNRHRQRGRSPKVKFDPETGREIVDDQVSPPEDGSR